VFQELQVIGPGIYTFSWPFSCSGRLVLQLIIFTLRTRSREGKKDSAYTKRTTLSQNPLTYFQLNSYRTELGPMVRQCREEEVENGS